jgi:hypothetical protein
VVGASVDEHEDERQRTQQGEDDDASYPSLGVDGV